MKRHVLISIAAVGLVALSACGDDSTSTSSATTAASAAAVTTTGVATTAGATTAAATTAAPAFPVDITNNGVKVTIAAKPAKIVSLSPTATETLYAIGAGSQVTAVDDQSNYPANAPKTDLSGFKPNIEAIVAKSPDLVVVSDDLNNVVAGLRALKIPVLLEPATKTIDDAYTQIDQLGAATGNKAGATATITTMKTKMDTLVKSIVKPARTLTVYHELDPGFYSATSSTFIGQIYKLAGLANIADAADKANTGYPQLSSEYIVKANPDVIALADSKCCAQNLKALAARPGFSEIAAVKNSGVVELDDDIASRWGPRTPDLLEAVVKAIAALPASATK